MRIFVKYCPGRKMLGGAYWLARVANDPTKWEIGRNSANCVYNLIDTFNLPVTLSECDLIFTDLALEIRV